MTLQELMQRAGIWRAGELSRGADGLGTGFDALDTLLPGGGWPRIGLTEILSSVAGIGALRLLLPALARLSREGGWLIWVCPPHVPYSPALRDYGVDLARMLIVELPEVTGGTRTQALWACEQALRFTDCAAALFWLEDASPLQLRRLQLAAVAGATWGLIFRPARFAAQTSPAPCRLLLEPGQSDSAVTSIAPSPLQITVLKARGGHPGAHCRLEV